MTFQKTAFVNFIILIIAFTEVTSWTIDLPDVRRFLFEKNEKYKKEHKNEYKEYVTNDDQAFYSNIEGNSKHNSDEEHTHHIHEEQKYDDDYEYNSYMEKKVYNIVRDGSTYLEGLQRSLEEYTAMLESCNRQNSSMQNSTSSNSTSWRPSYDPPSSPMSTNFTSNSSSILTFENYERSKVPWRPNATESTRSGSNRTGSRMSCDEATRASENVRRYAELATWTTKRLQDLAYAKNYQKTDEHEENELVLKLAWFLDRLAYLTGYEPDYKKEMLRGPRTTTSAPTAPTLVPSSEELTKAMRDCLERNSSEPATERCRYPMELPDLIQRMYDSRSTTPSTPTSDSNSVIPMSPPDSIPAQSSEILITSANSYPNTLSSPKSSITKRSTEYTYYFPPKPIHELSYPSPVVKLIKHRLLNIKAIVKTIVERRLAHIAEKKEEHKHFEKRSVDDSLDQTSNAINSLSNNMKAIVKSVEKRPLDDIQSPSELIHYPVSDVSVINTKSFKKRSIDERRTTSNHLNRLSNLKPVVKSIEKGPIARKKFEHFLSSSKKIKQIEKRNADDPMSKLANYYIKYKIWDSSNPTYIKKNHIKKASVYEVKNHLMETKPKVLKKRSLFKKKEIHLHMPKPLQIVRNYANYAHGHKYHHNHYKTNLLSKLNLLHDLKHKKLEKVHKKITKRSLHYEDMFLPRIPMNPQGDISYYVKSREGTNYNPSLAQAAQVRLGLEQIFQTGNIEIVRRYGSNYNPANPAPFYSGLLASIADA